MVSVYFVISFLKRKNAKIDNQRLILSQNIIGSNSIPIFDIPSLNV